MSGRKLHARLRELANAPSALISGTSYGSQSNGPPAKDRDLELPRSRRNNPPQIEETVWSRTLVCNYNCWYFFMRFEWDEAKASENLKKHGITFEEASLIFGGSVLTARDDRLPYGEERLISIGTIQKVAVIVVVHTDRNGVTRLISARLANKRERQRYHEHITATSGSVGISDG